MTKFIIFASARTGSTSLYNFFKDIGVRILFEPFRPNRWKTDYIVPEQLEMIYKHTDAIKHLWDHMTLEQNQLLLSWMSHHEVKVLFLTRREKIYQALSRVLAFQTDNWDLDHNDPEEKAAYETCQLYPISISLLDDYIQLHKYAEYAYEHLLQSNNVHTLHYEDLFNGETEAVQQNLQDMLQFLEISWSEWTERIAIEMFDPSNKQNKPSIYRRIPNWEEIRTHYQLKDK